MGSVSVCERSRGFFNREMFNRADHALESADTDFQLRWIFGTHAAIGGAPFEGDTPIGHSESNDRIKAMQSDQHVRGSAKSKRLPLNLIDDYGYNKLEDN